MIIKLTSLKDVVEVKTAAGKIYIFTLDKSGFLKCNDIPLQLAIKQFQQRNDLLNGVQSIPEDIKPDEHTHYIDDFGKGPDFTK
jgi:hypothetical protein